MAITVPEQLTSSMASAAVRSAVSPSSVASRTGPRRGTAGLLLVELGALGHLLERGRGADLTPSAGLGP